MKRSGSETSVSDKSVSEFSINSSIKKKKYWDFELRQPNFIREQSGFFGLGFDLKDLEEWLLLRRIDDDFFANDPSLSDLSYVFRDAGILCPLTEELEVPISKSIGDLIEQGLAISTSEKKEVEEVKAN